MSQAGVIDGLQFAREAQEKHGILDTQDLQRLAQAGCSGGRLEYALRGAILKDGKPWLRISVSGELQLICQRCLEPVEWPVAIEAELQLSEDEREVETAEDDIDRALAKPSMNVAQMVEDEVILALPMVPRHEQCEHADAGKPERISPFGALSALKVKQER